MMKGPYY
jgi:chloramphenicol 3-O-phosphotransferase